MFARILALTLKELLAVLRDKRSRFVLIGPPIIQLMIFGYAATFDLNDIPLAIYNEDAANGEDTLFHKAAEWLQPLKPPLVALDITPGRGVFIPMFTLGGLDTLPTGEVRTAQGDVIPGLYAAGRTACGIEVSSVARG